MKMRNLCFTFDQEDGIIIIRLHGYYNKIKYGVSSRINKNPTKEQIRKAKRILLKIFRRTQEELNNK